MEESQVYKRKRSKEGSFLVYKGPDFPAEVMIRSHANFGRKIYQKLKNNEARLRLFQESCFGNWLDVQVGLQEPLLLHALFLHEVYREWGPLDEVMFYIQGTKLKFGRREFCLITGLPFGPFPEIRVAQSTIHERLFPDTPQVTVRHLSVMFNDDVVFNALPDNEAVKVCLLLLVCFGLKGNEVKHVVPNDLLNLVENLKRWNSFPWGEYIWAATWPELKHRLWRKEHYKNTLDARPVRYNLQSGFPYALQVWIYETFPSCTKLMAGFEKRIPRILGWIRPVRQKYETCYQIFHHNVKNCEIIKELIPTDEEARSRWWIENERSFGKNKVVESRRFETKGQEPAQRVGLHQLRTGLKRVRQYVGQPDDTRSFRDLFQSVYRLEDEVFKDKNGVEQEDNYQTPMANVFSTSTPLQPPLFQTHVDGTQANYQKNNKEHIPTDEDAVVELQRFETEGEEPTQRVDLHQLRTELRKVRQYVGQPDDTRPFRDLFQSVYRLEDKVFKDKHGLE